VDVEPPGGDRYWHHVVRLRKAAVMAAREIWSAASVAALPLLLMKR
jgi:hypothetical protein